MTSLFTKTPIFWASTPAPDPKSFGSGAGKMTMLLSIVFRVSRKGPRNRRSLGFARDDKKERVGCRERAVAG